MNDGTSAQKEQGFEKGMVHQMEEPEGIRRQTTRECHVTELRAR
jgi:hypothetical protein